MSLRLQPVRVATGSPDTAGQLAFADGFLVAVLVLLSDGHAEAGMWFLEAGFGRVNTATPPMFADIDPAQNWIEQRLVRTA
ncbi:MULTISPECIES: hypothetical protein [unclassified Methylobacterium]|jgi:hypothetical protein|uniref:hypothetical protein n=1 Tax=unclassified Methylobacterium TaxID=2615210 RepID=UPI0005BDCAD0|nr:MULTISPECIES: hypothetical protein [unclassified Methylobacterium]SFV13129.1 hypothetical protein SAMN02799643_05836 [Methylobacterium sp. UNCCL125]